MESISQIKCDPRRSGPFRTLNNVLVAVGIWRFRIWSSEYEVHTVNVGQDSFLIVKPFDSPHRFRSPGSVWTSDSRLLSKTTEQDNWLLSRSDVYGSNSQQASSNWQEGPIEMLWAKIHPIDRFSHAISKANFKLFKMLRKSARNLSAGNLRHTDPQGLCGETGRRGLPLNRFSRMNRVNRWGWIGEMNTAESELRTTRADF